MSHSRSIVLTLGLLALLPHVFLLTAGGPWVLCVASDGHVAVEMQGASCCEEARGQVPPAGSGSSSERLADCADCLDLPLGSEHRVLAPRRPGFDLQVAVASQVPSPLSPPLDLTDAFLRPTPLDAAPCAQRDLSSTVLLR